MSPVKRIYEFEVAKFGWVLLNKRTDWVLLRVLLNKRMVWVLFKK